MLLFSTMAGYLYIICDECHIAGDVAHLWRINVEECFEGDHYETLAICRTLAFARAVFAVAIEEKPASWFPIRNRTRVVQRHPKGDW